jgi:TM2 domain-containing membrane protein YozV
MYCSNCGSLMEDGQMFCDDCGSRAGDNRAANSGGGQGPQYTINIRDKSAGVAAVLSFLIMGLGQIYVGKIARGILLMLAYTLFAVITTIFIFDILASYDWFDYTTNTGIDDVAGLGIILIIVGVCSFIIWIWNIFDAYKLANKYNDHLMATGTRLW